MHISGSLVIHLIWILIRLLRPGGTHSVIAESLLIKHQLLILNRSRRRAPALRPSDRVIAGVLATMIRPTRLVRSAIVLKPSTIMSFHRALVRRKYHLLFTPKRHGKPGPKGPSPELIAAICEMKRRNPSFGYQRIAQQLSLVLEIQIDKDIVRRVLANHFRPDPGDHGTSWLTFLGHTKDSLWSLDFFRCESLILKSHWVMVVMDQYTRQIVGIAVNAGPLDGPAICRMFGHIISRVGATPKAISSDHDPLFEFHRWKANLRILEIQEIKTVPHVPLSHPFVERIIGTIRRELLDHVPFWTSTDSSGSSKRSATTTELADIGPSMAQHQSPHDEGPDWRNRSNGNDIAAVFTSCRLRLEQEFAPTGSSPLHNVDLHRILTAFPQKSG